MLILAALLVGLMVTYRRGLDIASITLAGTLFYYYPILAFDEIIWISDGLHASTVTPESRITVALLLLGYTLWALSHPVINFNLDNFPKRKLDKISQGSLLIAVLFAVMLFWKNHSIGAASKVELMVNVGYELKLYEAACSIYFISAHISKSRLRMAISATLAVFSLYLGFRFLMTALLISYFVIHPIKGRRNITYAALAAVALAAALMLSKLFHYGIPSMEVVDSVIEFQLKGSNIIQNISLANGESSSTSAIFNEVILQDFRISLSYWVDVIVSVLPAANSLGFGDIEGFAEIYKNSIATQGIESFAASMYALGFSTLGHFGVVLFFALHLVIIYLFRKSAELRKFPEARLFSIHALTIAVFYAHRNDAIYTISLLKAALFILIACWILERVTKIFKYKRNNSLNPFLNENHSPY